MNRHTSSIRIRLAGASDAVVIAAVLYESFVAYRASYTPAAFTATTPTPDQIQQRLHAGPIWVAVDNDTIVGTLSAVQHGMALYLRSLAVLPTARGQGIGNQLMHQAERFAAAHGATQLLLSTTPFLAHAIQLYVQLGFQTTNDDPHALFGTPLLTMTKTVTLAE
jgi:ribosomal protein S18 acetylase RimI-like enzyme